ncbi:MAG: hypothetical protein ABIQ73_11740 [Acidimicrobiales bacterium]
MTIKSTIRTPTRTRWLAAAAAGALWLSACGDDSSAQDKARDAASELDSAVDAGIARGQAEIFRQRAKDLVRQGEALDSMSVLEEAARDLPRSPTVTGLGDGNNDGRDDDGKVQIAIDDSYSCVVISGTDIAVSGSRC